ncbi:uncharacterized protein LOC142981868 [Anticarsia gemmatalis]|uniref:uncharacterized protein LOC142981868 n=1 Tax=Anticarsia gemmatalis TaxID=129554 RepID=UPI003F757A2D
MRQSLLTRSMLSDATPNILEKRRATPSAPDTIHSLCTGGCIVTERGNKMHPPVHNECIVSGALGVALRFSRIFGVASLSMERVNNDWRISVSRPAKLYGNAINCIAASSMFIALANDANLPTEVRKYFQSGSRIVATVITVTMVSSVLFSEVFTGTNRMQHTIASLAQIQKINTELNQHETPGSHERIEWFLVTWSLIIGNINVLANSALLTFDIINTPVKIEYLQLCYLTFQMQLVMMHSLMLQVSLVHIKVLATFEHLNDCLRSKLRQLRKGDIPQSLSEEIPATIHRLGIHYCTIGDIVHQLSDCSGLLLATMIISFLMHFIITFFNLYISIYGDDPDLFESMILVAWVIYHAGNLLMIVEPCHRTCQQVSNKMHPPVHNECIVSGALGVALRFSRIFGVASLSMERVNNDWRISVSRPAKLYGNAINCIAASSMFIALANDANLPTEVRKYFQSGSRIVATVITVTMVSSVLFSEVFTGTNRMQHTIASLAQIQKVLS